MMDSSFDDNAGEFRVVVGKGHLRNVQGRGK